MVVVAAGGAIGRAVPTSCGDAALTARMRLVPPRVSWDPGYLPPRVFFPLQVRDGTGH